MMLEEMGLEVELASSGAQAIDTLQKTSDKNEPIDIVLMDWEMQGMDGIETSGLIKDIDKLSKKPLIVMVTAHGHDDIIDRSRKAGIDAFLLKPVSRSMLLSAIMELAEKNSTQKLYTTDQQINNKEEKAITGAHVLLVEDNDINQLVAQELLKQASVNVDIAANGQEAVEMVRSGNYDAVLMDIQMPVLDGYEATGMIRRDPRFKNLPIIAMTANALLTDVDRCLKAGMDDHLAKPIDPKKLYTTLGAWI